VGAEIQREGQQRIRALIKDFGAENLTKIMVKLGAKRFPWFLVLFGVEVSR
jgi:hypothetical protein